MVSKRKLSKSDAHGDSLIAELPQTKKSRISCKEKTSAEVGVVENNNIFVQLIKSAGITLNAGERQNDIAVDQATFQKKLCQILRMHPFYPRIVQEFVSGLETHIKDRDQFRNCLLPCAPVRGEGMRNLVHSYCESLIKLLLGIETLQPAIITVLLEKLPEFFFDTVGTFGTNFPRLIVNQFKWLDKILDSKDLVMKLMQMVSVSPAPIQHDIITSLPEILEDSQQSEVAREVSQLLKRDNRLTVPILDALSSLDLDAGLLAEVRQSAMIIVPAVKLEDLPVVIKFILHNIKAVDAVEVISALRKNLDLSSCILPLQMLSSQSKLKSQPQMSSSTSQVSSSQNCVKLLFDVIKSAVRFQKGISEAWIKAIENTVCVSDHKVLDLIVLLLIHTTNTKSRKQIERVLRNKIPLGCVPEQLLQSAFRNHSLVIKDFFPSILSLAQTFLHSADPCVVSFGSCMYKQAFAAFDSYCQQEVVSALVTHVCGGNDVEMDISLDVLTDLVTLHTSSLIRYATFVKNILDYTEKLNPQQIRKLFYILGELAFSQRQEDSYIQDDMHMVIRKWLSSTVPKYKQMGIIGAITVAGSMAAKRHKEDGCSLERTQQSEEHCRQLSILLDLVSYCCEQSPEALALYYDELANLIEKQKGNLDSQILERIGKSVVEDFSNDFVVDLTPAVDGVHLFPVKSLYNLDEDESQGTIVINLLPLLSQNWLGKSVDENTTRNQGKKIVSPECLSPSFRLLRLYTTEQHNGSMEEIDALLGCPLHLTDLEIEGKLDSLAKQEREFLCSLLFHSLNWFREVVNAFCQQQDLEMKGKVLTRLQNITELQNMLGKCLAASPGYVPPRAIFDCEALEAAPTINAVGLVKKKKTGEKKQKSEGSKDSSADHSQMEENPEGNQPEAETTQLEKALLDTTEKKSGIPLVQLQSYRAFFRELDLEVFTILHCGLLTKSILDSEMHTEAREIVQLGPAELVFLLDDLCQKLEHILIPPAAKRAPFLKQGKACRKIGFSHLCQRSSQEVAQCAVELLKPLCNHMENMHNYFQALMTENQGVVDGPRVDIQEHQLMSSCYQQLLQAFRFLFAWSGFSQRENSDLLRSALKVLADRLKPGETGFLLLEDLISESFHYLLNFQHSVPNFQCALTLTQLLIVIAEKPVASWKKDKIASLAKQFLCQSWMQLSGTREKGSQFSDALHTLLCVYMEHTDNILKAVEDISSVGVPELINSANDGYSSTYPTLTRQTFPVFFQVMMAQLENSARSISAGKPSDSSEVQLEKLLHWNMTVRDFHILVNLVKVFDSRPVLSICLKYGRLFVEAFLKLAMPLLDYSFKKHREDVQSLLKTLQLSTRQLHHMCGHSKIHQDLGLTNHVPLLKKSLEQFVYRVKAMLAFNHCQEAFWVGILKNRDLQGEEILSQDSEENDPGEGVSQLPREDPAEGEGDISGSEGRSKHNDDDEESSE
ncbi:Fanconi anemia group D2 protein isoform X1 [Malaclemys terrapin pileata]|uniref:Fanconi anemia group D2 protein isoform X1 n=1 Tax=Malaclemys terrapin pileata TaxID=2991368 RepID=UPI0023A8D749|nr:Fanconi anemia group D2 protein isoform X1 [Malaclemys terrapin pileata]XP_053890196.1 Fanconi anemia group D2 protein isoform X1 [Malaclemys terrapin pileata]